MVGVGTRVPATARALVGVDSVVVAEVTAAAAVADAVVVVVSREVPGRPTLLLPRPRLVETSPLRLAMLDCFRCFRVFLDAFHSGG